MAQKPEEKMDEVKGEVYEPAPRGAARVASSPRAPCHQEPSSAANHTSPKTPTSASAFR